MRLLSHESGVAKPPHLMFSSRQVRHCGRRRSQVREAETQVWQSVRAKASELVPLGFVVMVVDVGGLRAGAGCSGVFWGSGPEIGSSLPCRLLGRVISPLSHWFVSSDPGSLDCGALLRMEVVFGTGRVDTVRLISIRTPSGSTHFPPIPPLVPDSRSPDGQKCGGTAKPGRAAPGVRPKPLCRPLPQG